jgi:putative tryptophan/tyrosine transport system substrate-binding protein
MLSQELGADMQRREFIKVLVSVAAAWPLAARAQQPAMPVAGFLGSGSLQSDAFRLAAVRQGLTEAGYVEGRNVAFEYRWAEGKYERLPALAAELVRRGVAVMISIGGVTSAVAAKSSTTTIPVVFATGGDPIKLGLVASLNRPGGNVTGVNFLTETLVAKQFEVLHETVSGTALIGLLVNPTSETTETEREMKSVLAAADTLGRKLLVVQAHTDGEIDAAFVMLAQQHAGALMVLGDAFFLSRRNKLVELAARQSMPTMYNLREYPAAGGLMSYGTSITDAHRIAGLYAGRILKGEKPADLPVQQSTKVELIVNLKTAKALSLTVPPQIVARADEVIE